MIVIRAGQQDEAARFLAARWKAYDARLLTPRDLSIAGWRHQPYPSRDHIAVVASGEWIAGWDL